MRKPCPIFRTIQSDFQMIMFNYRRLLLFLHRRRALLHLVGKCRFWDSSIFRIRFSFRFWCDDVTSTRCSRDGLWRRRFWDSSIFRIGFSFDDVTSTRGSRDDLWRRRFWAILVRRWWSCAAVFHCDILNP